MGRDVAHGTERGGLRMCRSEPGHAVRSIYLAIGREVFYPVILDESAESLSLSDLATGPIRVLATLCVPSGLLSSSLS